MSEILGTLFKYLITFICVSGVVAVIYDIFAANKVASAISQVYLFQKNISVFYTGGPTPAVSAPLTTIIVNANLEPSGTASGSNLVNPWGGAITISGNQRSTGYVDIIYQNIPVSACVNLALAMSPYYLITINNSIPSLGSQGVINTLPTSLSNSVVPITAQQVAQQCNAQAQYQQPSIYFTFPIRQN